MGLRILDATTRAAVAAATSQQGQCEALRDAFSGNPEVRIYGAGLQHLRTVVLGPFGINSNTPRGLTCGAAVSDTAVAPSTPGAAGITPTLWEFRDGSTVIFDTAAITHGAIKTLCRPTFGGVVFTAQASLPVEDNPLADSLDIIATAHAAGQMWVRLDDPDNAPTFLSVIPPDDLLDHSGGSPNNPRGMFYVWASWAYNPTTHKFTCWGVGHANSGAGEVISFNPTTRGFRLDFYGPESVQVDPFPIYRSKDFNKSPVSAHNYCSSVYTELAGRYFVLPGASHGNGNSNKVFDPEIPGDQTGLRPVGAWSLDMTLAGQGYVAGETGSNYYAGSYGPLTGAEAWRLHDWFDPAHASLAIFGGTSYSNHINAGAVATVEDGKDVVYYTANGFSLLRSELHPTDSALDVNSLIFNDISFYPEDPLSGGNLAFDPVDRVLVSLARGAGSYEPFRFVDLKRSPVGGWRRPTSPTGQAALKAESHGEPGLIWDPVDGCYVGFCRGSIATPGESPAGMWRIYKPAPSGGETPDAGWSISLRSAPGGSPLPSVEPLPSESFPNICGRFRWADDMRVGLFATRYEVWAYIPENWTDPRA